MSMDDVEHVGAVLRPPREGAAEDFFRAITDSGDLPVGIDADEATSVVLCALLSRLDLEQGKQLLDTLPSSVRDAAGRCPIHGGEPGQSFGKAELLARVAEHVQLAPEAVESLVRAVFRALRAQLPPRVNATIQKQLPRDLVALWRGGARR